MLGLSAVPGALLFLLILPSTDSPRWYVKAGRPDDAAHALGRLHPDGTDGAMRDLEVSVAGDVPDAAWREVFARRWHKPLVIGVGLAVFQQITGINAIIYYADRIFAAAGFATPAQQTAATTWAIGGVNVLATLIAVAFVDRLGRKPLLLAGLVGMAVSLTVVGISFLSLGDVTSTTTSTGHASDAGAVTLVALVVYIISFAFSLGPVVWTVINEIFPRDVRGRGVAVATAFNWGTAWLVSQFFLTLVDTLGESGTFWLFALFCVLAYVWIWRSVPETKGRSLEEIEAMFADAHAAAG
jgi:sugar porter (SP) family MFS transporter